MVSETSPGVRRASAQPIGGSPNLEETSSRVRSGSGRLIAVSLPAFGASTQRLPAGEDVLWFAAAERAFSSGESAFARLCLTAFQNFLRTG